MRTYIALLFALLISLVAVGCGDDGFTEVSGSVTLDGAPLPEGEILFIAPDNSSSPSAGKITDGRFTARASYGAKKVQINATRDTGRKEMDGWPIRESIIPAQYNTKTGLTAEVQRQGRNVFAYDLKTRP
jgi:hypothetical protein